MTHNHELLQPAVEQLTANLDASLQAQQVAIEKRAQARTPIGKFIGSARIAYRGMLIAEDEALLDAATYGVIPEPRQSLDFRSEIPM